MKFSYAYGYFKVQIAYFTVSPIIRPSTVERRGPLVRLICSQQITRTEATKLHYCLMSQQGPPRDVEGQSPCLLDFHPLGPRTVGHQSDFV